MPSTHISYTFHRIVNVVVAQTFIVALIAILWLYAVAFAANAHVAVAYVTACVLDTFAAIVTVTAASTTTVLLFSDVS